MAKHRFKHLFHYQFEHPEMDTLERNFIDGVISDQEYDIEMDMIIANQNRYRCQSCGQERGHTIKCLILD